MFSLTGSNAGWSRDGDHTETRFIKKNDYDFCELDSSEGLGQNKIPGKTKSKYNQLHHTNKPVPQAGEWVRALLYHWSRCWPSLKMRPSVMKKSWCYLQGHSSISTSGITMATVRSSTVFACISQSEVTLKNKIFVSVFHVILFCLLLGCRFFILPGSKIEVALTWDQIGSHGLKPGGQEESRTETETDVRRG